MKQHETNIDTVAFQMDFKKAEDQRRKLSLLCQWVTTIRELGKLVQDKSSRYIIKYDVYFGGTIIFTIHSGFTSKADCLTGESEGLYYIRIRFAGLKSHKQRQDEASNALMTICGWLNTTRTKYRMVELDVSIDTFCSFDNILAICVNKSGKTTYNEIGHKQYYKGTPTSYIEKYRNEQEANNAVLRAYLYNKSAKEALIGSIITRFELKFQNRFFLKYGFNEKAIMEAMNRYYVMFFDSIQKKTQYVNILNNFKSTPKEMEILGLNRFRLHPNGNVIKAFIRQVESVYVGFYGDIVIPVVNHRLSEKNL